MLLQSSGLGGVVCMLTGGIAESSRPGLTPFMTPNVSAALATEDARSSLSANSETATCRALWLINLPRTLERDERLACVPKGLDNLWLVLGIDRSQGDFTRYYRLRGGVDAIRCWSLKWRLVFEWRLVLEWRLVV